MPEHSLSLQILQKKLTRRPRSSAAKQDLHRKNLNDLETNGERQADKSDMTPKISQCAPITQSNTYSHETKQGFKQISQTASDSSLQTEMRSEASSQVLFQTPSPGRSVKPTAFKRTQKTFKCQESYTSLDNLKTPAKIPFQRPGTLRPKCCPESLKGKKALEQRCRDIRPGAIGMSNYQQNRRGLHNSPPLTIK